MSHFLSSLSDGCCLQWIFVSSRPLIHCPRLGSFLPELEESFPAKLPTWHFCPSFLQFFELSLLPVLSLFSPKSQIGSSSLLRKWSAFGRVCCHRSLLDWSGRLGSLRPSCACFESNAWKRLWLFMPILPMSCTVSYCKCDQTWKQAPACWFSSIQQKGRVLNE